MDVKKITKQEFSRKEKLDIIQEYLTTKKTVSELSRDYGVSSSHFIISWINSFNIEIKNSPIIDKKKINSNIEKNLESIEKLRNKPEEQLPNDQIFTREQKYKIVKEYLSSNLSQMDICRKHGIKWRTSISSWKNNIEKEILRKHQILKKISPQEKTLLDLILSNKKAEKRRVFTKKFKNSIIEEYETKEITKTNISRKYKISTGLISKWILDNEAKKIKKELSSKINLTLEIPIKISKEQKKQILKEYLSNNLSQSQIMKKYGIKSSSSISKWKNNIEKELLEKEEILKNLSLSEQELLELIFNHKTRKKARNHTKELKLSIINEYKETEITKSELSRKYDICKSLITIWISDYELKNKSILNQSTLNNLENDNLEHEKELNSDTYKFNPMSKKSKETLTEENKRLKRELKNLESERQSRETIKDKKLSQLKARIRELEAENYKKTKETENEQFKRICYDTLIDVAEKELNIEIRKKYEVKQ
ncbi:MAG: transposase [Bacteroidetes bacterium]|nr:transposase [Bacteroidota bacterium]